MVIEYIKRGQRMGYDGDKLVYKVPYVEGVPYESTTTTPVEEVEHAESGNEPA